MELLEYHFPMHKSSVIFDLGTVYWKRIIDASEILNEFNARKETFTSIYNESEKKSWPRQLGIDSNKVN